MEIKEELPGADADGELDSDQLLVDERMVAARPNGAIGMGDDIERIIASDLARRLAACLKASATYAATRRTE